MPANDQPRETADARRARLDVALVERGLVVSRARARDLILRGEVTVNGAVAGKVALAVGPADRIGIAAGAGAYVSRGYLKLAAALDHFALSPEGRVCLDVGASTGGFTEVLLARGARRVHAVDNGRDQLHASLRADPRVSVREGFDARRLTRAEVPEPVGAIVADVSFIALAKVLPAALALAAAGCWLVALVKPQFEAEPADIPRTGVITDAAVHARAVAGAERWIAAQRGWRLLGTLPSPVKGGDGNTEFLLAAVHDV